MQHRRPRDRRWRRQLPDAVDELPLFATPLMAPPTALSPRSSAIKEARAVGGLVRDKSAAAPRHPLERPTCGRHSRTSPPAFPVTGEVNPPAVTRPRRGDLIFGLFRDPHRRAALSIDSPDVDMAVGLVSIKRVRVPVRRPVAVTLAIPICRGERRAAEPSAAATQIAIFPERPEVNASRRPSGEKRGPPHTTMTRRPARLGHLA